jgi:hypothetical protein
MNDGDDKMNQNLTQRIPPQGVHLHQHNNYNTYNNYQAHPVNEYPKRGIGDYLTDLFTGFQVYVLLCIIFTFLFIVLPAVLGYDVNKLDGPNSMDDFYRDAKVFFLYVLVIGISISGIVIFVKLYFSFRKEHKPNVRRNTGKEIQRYH